ncbi:MAG: HEAT repeat domain-containing protein [Leptolyngbyaceae cyanobacterium HOT.MB2.61]|jgi:bilin biosynthesis protein|nr:HEAT repeat domain-containing protein [Leptolyngbyaceae cyanobacterium HOT.MB2.61]
MNSFFHADTVTVENSPLLAQAEMDALLQAVNEQISLHTFDFNDQQILQRMVQGLADPRRTVRSQITEIFGEIGEAATPLLINALANHSDPVMRRSAAKALTLIADPTAIPTLLQAVLQDEDATVRGSAIGALARIGEASVPYFLVILESPDYPESIKGYAAWALASIGPEATDQVYRTLSSESVDVRCAGVGAIAQIAKERAEERAFRVLIATLTDPDPIVRTAAVAALGQLRHKPAVPHLILALQDKDGDVRKAVVNALGRIGEPTALVHLTALLKDEVETVQQLVMLAISQIETHSEPSLD